MRPPLGELESLYARFLNFLRRSCLLSALILLSRRFWDCRWEVQAAPRGIERQVSIYRARARRSASRRAPAIVLVDHSSLAQHYRGAAPVACSEQQ